MSKRTIVVGWVILVLLTGAAHAAAAEDEQGFLGIITGDVKSTAHHVGMDLKASGQAEQHSPGRIQFKWFRRKHLRGIPASRNSYGPGAVRRAGLCGQG
jgi:opacity protein-like surface antigen